MDNGLHGDNINFKYATLKYFNTTINLRL